LQTATVDILLRNTRLPQSAQGDRNGQINALNLGVRRLDALIAEFAALPDGRWEAGDFLDNDGISDTPLPIRVALEIKGEDLTLDFTGSAPAPAGPVNIPRGTAIACVHVATSISFPCCLPTRA